MNPLKLAFIAQTRAISILILTTVLTACGGASSSSSTISCSFPIASTPQSLTASETLRLIAQAEQAATILNAKATIAVVDRVGNVLGVYKMTGALDKANLRSGRALASFPQGLDGVDDTIPSELAAISKALTGAYLSSSGNAFSTRTGSYIIQEHFPPTVNFQAGGPLFGVQFSQLPCGDLVTRGHIVGAGPKRSPLGLAGDPGGFPVYKNGVVVGGIGVISDGLYSIDLNPVAGTTDSDERIAQSALAGFEAPDCIRSNKITLGGQTPPYSNADGALVSVSNTSVTGPGNFITVPTYFDSNVALAGKAYGNVDSGFAADGGGTLGTGAFVMTNGAHNRYFPMNSISPLPAASGLSVTEVTQILNSAIGVANQSRAQIRRPLGVAAQVSVAVVDTAGNILGMSRSADAPVFGADVAVQKARTSAFFSSAPAGSQLTSEAPVTYPRGTVRIEDYVSASSTFGSTAFTGSHAFSSRAIGNISRPFFPDGINGSPFGPLSKDYSIWSPFNVGLQLDLVHNRLVFEILTPTLDSTSCTSATGITSMNNGMQIFPGSVPIYRGNTLIGAIGVSGDGVDQDDMVAFLGLSRASQISNTGYGNAPIGIRADTLSPQGSGLRFVNCPQAPFIDSTQQNVCSGI